MNHRIGRVAAGLGGLIGIVSFFLPWIYAGTLDVLLKLLQFAGAFLGTDLGDLVKQLQGSASLTGLQLAFDLPFVSTPFQILIGLPAIVSILAWVWLLLAALGVVQGARPVDWLLAILSVAAGIILGLNGATITHLGISLPLVSTALSALGIKLVWGFWGSLLGLALIAIGAGIGIAGSPDGDGEIPPY